MAYYSYREKSKQQISGHNTANGLLSGLLNTHSSLHTGHSGYLSFVRKYLTHPRLHKASKHFTVALSFPIPTCGLALPCNRRMQEATTLSSFARLCQLLWGITP